MMKDEAFVLEYVLVVGRQRSIGRRCHDRTERRAEIRVRRRIPRRGARQLQQLGGFGGAPAGAARRDGIRSGNARASIRPRPSSSWSAESTTRACCSRSSRRRPPRRRNCSVGLLAKNGGQLDRRTLMRKLHVDHGTFKRIALTLHMCDMIDEERLDARKFIYTLKNAA